MFGNFFRKEKTEMKSDQVLKEIQELKVLSSSVKESIKVLINSHKELDKAIKHIEIGILTSPILSESTTSTSETKVSISDIESDEAKEIGEEIPINDEPKISGETNISYVGPSNLIKITDSNSLTQVEIPTEAPQPITVTNQLLSGDSASLIDPKAKKLLDEIRERQKKIPRPIRNPIKNTLF